MKYFLLLFPLLAAADPTTITLEALQQLNSLIPERLWFQEFSISVSQDFEQIARDKEPPLFSLAPSSDYLLRTTLSGENIRMLDLYQEFEQSPFWVTPK